MVNGSMLSRKSVRASDAETKLAEDIKNLVLGIVEARLKGAVTRDGRVPARVLQGMVPGSSGGTGNVLGQATPLDGSVTDAKVAVGADIDPAKLDPDLLLSAIYLLVKAELVAGTGVIITPNDGAHTLTLSATASAFGLDDLTDVELFDVQEGDILVYLSGKWRNVHGVVDSDLVYWDGSVVEWGGEPVHWG